MNNIKNKSYSTFLMIWFAQLIANIGSGLTAFSLGVYVFQKEQTATSVALVTLCSFLPSILLSPIGGVLADRFDRRMMMIIGDLGSALGLIFILATMQSGAIKLWQICIGVAFSSVFVALLAPAYKATVTDLLTEDQFSKASGLVQTAASSQYLLSPIIAGFLLNATNIETILIIDISTLAVTISAVFLIKKNLQPVQKNRQTQHFLIDLRDGWKTVTSNKGIFHLILLLSAITFYIGFLQTLLGPMVLSFSDAQTLGMAKSVSAIGMLVSSLFIGILGIRQKYTAMLITGLSFAGLFFSLMGLKANIYFITGAGFLFFCALPFINTSADVLIRRHIPNEQQGRAWGIIGVVSQLGYIVAYGLAGFLADRVFNPLLMNGGLLAPTVGKIIGTGPGRGIGLLFIISGVFVIVLAVIVSGAQSIRDLERD